jgi:hypothetical protein
VTNRRWTSGMLTTEDWWAVWVGLAVYAAGLMSLAGVDLVGWMARPRTWEWSETVGAFGWGKLLGISGSAYADWHPLAGWIVTYVVFTGLLSIGAYFQRLNMQRFITGFTVIFLLTWAC